MASFRSAIWVVFGVLVAVLAVASPFSALLLLALAGGLVVAAVTILLGRRSRAGTPRFVSDPFEGASSTDVINFSRIRVAGFGGLGFVVAAMAVGLELVRVGQVLMVGAVGGTLAAIVLIVWRRRAGPISTSSQTPGASGVLHLEDPVPAPATDPASNTERPVHPFAGVALQPRS